MNSAKERKGDAAGRQLNIELILHLLIMPRRRRLCPAGTCFHVINRAVARLTLFEKQEDYEAFERVLKLAHSRVPLPIYAYCVMPNHWHLLV